ncbi:bifunctional oligoribonuclease/PAP phosphatase NrnA [Patescibacteria group bacterium]
MELNPKQQITDLIRKSKNILLLTHRNPDGDGLGAELACLLAFRKLQKTVTAIAEGEISTSYQFISAMEHISNKLEHSRDFIISVNTKDTQVGNLGYKIEGDKLNIVITPSKGNFTTEHVSFDAGKHPYDLIIVLDTPDIEQLGELYDNNANLFYEVPVINIDHHVSNEQYGKVNLVDITATSTCEIVLALLESLGGDTPILDEEISTALLMGIITDTGSFQNANTTPKSLTVAAQLVAAGARQQDIIKNIYKTKPLSTLRLWGRILAGIREDSDHKFVWSIAAARDLDQCGAQESEISGAIDELMVAAPNAEIIFLLSEREGGIFGSVRTSKQVDASEVAGMFGGGGHRQAAGFNITEMGLAEAERHVLEKIRRYQKKSESSQNSKSSLEEKTPNK